MLKRKVYEISSPEPEKEDEIGGPEKKVEVQFGGGLKCMMNGVIYYPGSDNVLEAEDKRKMRAALWATKIVEDDFDDEGRPRVKIVYVDKGPFPSESEFKNACKHIKTIVKAEKDKEKKEGGRPGPRLIFVEQDRDFWPESENDNDPDDLMARRATKEQKLNMSYTSSRGPDYKDVYVPEDEKARKAYPNDFTMCQFMRYFDPSLPGLSLSLTTYRPGNFLLSSLDTRPT